MNVLIKNGRVLDPGTIDQITDIYISNGVISHISENIEKPADCEKVVDATGKLVVPGLIDMHVHLREPGHEYKETVATGALAAAWGGFTAICAMPNTKPVNDNAQITEFILKQAQKAGCSRVYPVAAISMDLSGEAMCEYGELKDAGAVAISDDGMPVVSSLMMRRVMEYAAGIGLSVISHCEEPHLSPDGVMNEGEQSTSMGLAGIPNAVESIMVMRDIALSELTGTAIHIAHVSAAESVRAIREAKAAGIKVTCETAPHYFTLTDEAVTGYNTHAKMNPPLRTEKDRDAIIDGLVDGTIDVIATDHAPHNAVEKEVEFNIAANGIVGLETSLPLSMALVHKGILTIDSIIEKMSKYPAKILGLDNGIQKNLPADITIIDPELSYIVEPEKFKSKSRNTPFAGMELKGRAIMTIVGGKPVFEL